MMEITKDEKRMTEDERRKIKTIITTDYKILLSLREFFSKQSVIFFLNLKNFFVIKNIPCNDHKSQNNIVKFIQPNLLVSFFTITFLFGCSYSFTGSSVPSHLKSIYIPYCNDRSGSGEPTMADDFTNTLIEQFISDNSLAIAENKNADALLDCTINSISDAPAIIESGENVSARRITISARVLYKDFVHKKTVFDKSFSNYGDYENSGDVFTNRKAAIQLAIDKITEDILLGVVSDW